MSFPPSEQIAVKSPGATSALSDHSGDGGYALSFPEADWLSRLATVGLKPGS